MGYNIGETIQSFTLTSYNGFNTFNDGVNTYNPSTLVGPLLLAFVNVHNSIPESKWWFSHLKALKAHPDLAGVKFFVVAFSYDSASSSYQLVTTNQVRTAILNAGATNADFDGTPVVMDNGTGVADYGLYSQNHLSQILSNLGAPKDAWIYLADQSGRISDKWHSISPVGTDPLWFRRLRVARVDITGAFAIGDTATLDLSAIVGAPAGTHTVSASYDGSSYTYGAGLADPHILAVFPEPGSTSPTLRPIEVHFVPSLPAAGVPANYGISPSPSFGINVDARAFAAGHDATAHYAIAEHYALARLRYLVRSPRLLYADPMDDSLLTGYPGAGIVLAFSKPLEPLSVVVANFAPGGTGIDAAFAFAAPANNDVENAVALTQAAGNLVNPVGPPSPFTITLQNTNASSHLRDRSNALLTGDALVEYRVDLAAPAIDHVSSDTTDGTYGEGAAIDIDVFFSEEVTLQGTLNVLLDTGATVPVSASSYPATMLTGTYTVAPGHSSPDLNVTSVTPTAGSTLRDAAGRNATLATIPAGENLADHKAIVIDTAVPPIPSQNIVFVLDYSGTMDSPVSFDGSSKSKREWVQDAVRNFVTYLLGEVASSDYNIGIVNYSTDGIVALPLTPKSAFVQPSSVLENALAIVPTRELTAMGKGLAWALNILSYTTPAAGFNGSRAIVLLADGQQNVLPYVVPSETNAGHPGKDEFTIDTAQAASGCPAGMGVIRVQGGDIPIHTLGIGGNQTWLPTLADIADVTNATFRADDAVWPLAFEFFAGLTPSLFPYTSPQVLHNQREQYQLGGANRFPLQLNRSARKLVVSLAWAGSIPLSCTLRKGSRTVTPDRTVEANGLFIASVIFPHFQPRRNLGIHYGVTRRFGRGRDLAVSSARPLYRAAGKFVPGYELPGNIRIPIESDGDWEIEVTRADGGAASGQGEAFLFTVIVDEKAIDWKPIHLPRTIWAGEKIQVGFEINAKGHPIPSSAAIGVSMPVYSLPNLIVDHPAWVQGFSLRGNAGFADWDDFARLEREIVQKHKEASGLLSRRRTMVLRHGLFIRLFCRSVSKRGNLMTLPDSRIPGTYHIDYRVRAADRTGGRYERTTRQSLQVRVRPELASSDVKIASAGKILTVDFIPRDGIGNLLGPGFSSRFAREIAGAVVKDVVDTLNGAYRITIDLSRGESSAWSDSGKWSERLFEGLLHKYLEH
jgi:hypothetical protein